MVFLGQVSFVRHLERWTSPTALGDSIGFSRLCQPSLASPSRILAPACGAPPASRGEESSSVFLLYHERETTSPVPSLSVAWLQARMEPDQLMTRLVCCEAAWYRPQLCPHRTTLTETPTGRAETCPALSGKTAGRSPGTQDKESLLPWEGGGHQLQA